MRILAVADEESKYLWDYYEPEKLHGYDLIVACGDLNMHYMTFLASVAPMPVLYVHGNHDECYDMHAGGVDVLVTHAPLHGYGDLNDLPHRGFTVFREVLDAYKPAVMLHGHVHLSYGANIPREHQYGATRIINCYERFDLELPDRPEIPARGLFARLRSGR